MVDIASPKSKTLQRSIWTCALLLVVQTLACTPEPEPFCNAAQIAKCEEEKGSWQCQVNSCDESSRSCTPRLKPDNSACDDGNACTTVDVCDGGSCHGSEPEVCSDGNVCTEDSCDAAKGCAYQANSEKCDDGDTCTENDACAGWLCKAGAIKKCDDGNVCTADACEPSSGCTNKTTGCDDGNICTDDTCAATTGCSHAWNTKPCDDGQACSSADACVDGKCQGGSWSSWWVSTNALGGVGDPAPTMTTTADGSIVTARAWPPGLQKFDASGNSLWVKTKIAQSSGSDLRAHDSFEDGRLCVTGMDKLNGNATWIRCFDSSGNLAFGKEWAGTVKYNFRWLAVNNFAGAPWAGAIAAGGLREANGNDNGYLVNLRTWGDESSDGAAQYNWHSPSYGAPVSVHRLDAGPLGVVALGWDESLGKATVSRLSPELAYTVPIPTAGNGTDSPRAIDAQKSGGPILALVYGSGDQTRIVEVSATGQIGKTHKIGTGKARRAESLRRSLSHKHWLLGGSSNTAGGDYGWVAKYTESGTMMWEASFKDVGTVARVAEHASGDLVIWTLGAHLLRIPADGVGTCGFPCLGEGVAFVEAGVVRCNK